jgi:acyl-CoA reductase-like NAD-dependent aldehyde dehydrogenase
VTPGAPGSATLLNPATEQVVDVVPHTSAEATDEAIARARAASPAWRAVAPADRARLLRRFAAAVDADVEHLAALEVANSGHTIGNARWEAGNVRDTAPAAVFDNAGQDCCARSRILVERSVYDSPYGLSGSIWTENVGRALRVARGVESGNLSVNSHSSVRYWTPFGGLKRSGLGRELGPDALDALTEDENVFIATDRSDP